MPWSGPCQLDADALDWEKAAATALIYYGASVGPFP